MKIKPLHDWAIIKRDKPQEKTSGGVIIPEVAQDIPMEGVIVAIGSGMNKSTQKTKKEKFVPTILKPGQHVLFMEYATREVELDGQEFIFVREEDIFAAAEIEQSLAVRGFFPVEKKKEHAVAIKGNGAIVLSAKSVGEKEFKPQPAKTFSRKKKSPSKKESPSRQKKTSSPKKSTDRTTRTKK